MMYLVSARNFYDNKLCYYAAYIDLIHVDSSCGGIAVTTLAVSPLAVL